MKLNLLISFYTNEQSSLFNDIIYYIVYQLLEVMDIPCKDVVGNIFGVVDMLYA